MDLTKVTRLEIIDYRETELGMAGRVFAIRDPNAKLQAYVQDEGRTLKIFVASKEEEPTNG